MTKYKEYLRAHGIDLECDFECLPYNSIECVDAFVLENGVGAVAYSNCAGANYAVFNRSGECSYFDSDGYKAYVRDPHYDPEYIDWLHDVGLSNYAFVFTWMKRLYRGEHEVRIAFKHMKVGIMSEEVFCRWLAKRYKNVLSLYGVC